MGLDRFANFISKSINTDSIEEININSNLQKNVSSHVLFDLNFLVYQEIIKIENEVNDIIKIILCLPFICDSFELLENQLKLILQQPHWYTYCKELDIITIFDGYNESEIISNFINLIYSNTKTDINNLDNSKSIIELIINEKISLTLIDLINKIHYVPIIQHIDIFFDGIPSLSKIIEQRRRRMRNYLESINKKNLFKQYFENLNISYSKLSDCISKKYSDDEINDIFIFDYFKWLKNRFSIDKSLGPSSNFMINLELYIEQKLKVNFPSCNIYINGPKINGESDMKIFNYIVTQDIMGDYCIHTTDSDLIHQILVQQVYYKIHSKDIGLTVCKHIKSYNLDEYVQILNASLIIKNILELYNTINNIKTNNYKIIWDLCLVFYLFGNDHLPPSIEIGPELGLDFFIKKHYQALNKANIVNIKRNHISIDFNNFKLFLEKINESKLKNITKIYLLRFFKISNVFLNLLVDKFNITYNNINLFLKNFILYQACKLYTDDQEKFSSLNNYDLRKVYFEEINKEEINKYLDLSVFDLTPSQNNILLESEQIIISNIDYYDDTYGGLIIYLKPLNITSDPYQDLYNYIIEKANKILNNSQYIFYDHINLDNHKKIIQLHLDNNLNADPNDYLKKMYHLTITQFGYMKDFYSDNITFYKYYNVPSLDSIIDFLQTNMNVTKKWLKEIREENIEPNKYLNSINHYIIITPFLLAFNLPKDIVHIVDKIENINNLWIDQNNINNFSYRDFDFNTFIKEWSNAIIKVNLINKTTKINNELISLNTDFI